MQYTKSVLSLVAVFSTLLFFSGNAHADPMLQTYTAPVLVKAWACGASGKTVCNIWNKLNKQPIAQWKSTADCVTFKDSFKKTQLPSTGKGNRKARAAAWKATDTAAALEALVTSYTPIKCESTCKKILAPLAQDKKKSCTKFKEKFR
tara:strand:- start:269 stop:712 length:444 start_codon:yes stop_codon:yes gene_type:complete